MISRLRTALAKQNTAYIYGLYVCAFCFLLTKAIVPSGFMFSGNPSKNVMTFCHGDARSAMLSDGLVHESHGAVDADSVHQNLPYTPSDHASSIMLCGFAVLTYMLALIGLVVFAFVKRAQRFRVLYVCCLIYSPRYLRPTLRGPPKSQVLFG